MCTYSCYVNILRFLFLHDCGRVVSSSKSPQFIPSLGVGKCLFINDSNTPLNVCACIYKTFTRCHHTLLSIQIRPVLRGFVPTVPKSLLRR